MSFFMCLAAIEQPAIKPPPPTGTNKTSISLQSVIISYEIVPCPKITLRSLYGCISIKPLLKLSLEHVDMIHSNPDL